MIANNHHPYTGLLYSTQENYKPSLSSYKEIISIYPKDNCDIISEGNIYPHKNSTSQNEMFNIIFSFKGDKLTYKWFFRGILYNDLSFTGKMQIEKDSRIEQENYNGTYSKTKARILLSGYSIISGTTQYCFIILNKSDSNKSILKKERLISIIPKSKQVGKSTKERTNKIYIKGKYLVINNKLIRAPLSFQDGYYDFINAASYKSHDAFYFRPDELNDKIIIRLKYSRLLNLGEVSRILFDNTKNSPVLKIEIIFPYFLIIKMKFNPLNVFNRLISELKREGFKASLNISNINIQGLILNIEHKIKNTQIVEKQFESTLQIIKKQYLKLMSR